jgi:DUF1009 family protein
MTFGILAGGGLLPVLVAEALGRDGIPFVTAGLLGQTDRSVFPNAAAFESVPIGAFKKAAHFFLSNDAKRIFFLGGVKRKGVLLYTRPDTAGIRLMLSALFRGDDRLLREASSTFSKLGIEVADPSFLLYPLFAESGLIAGPIPSDETLRDLTAGRNAALVLGRKDKGQAVVAKGGCVLRCEDRRGTDALIASVSSPGAVLVKMVKPGQDRRFDLPAVGPKTILRAALSDITAVGVESGGVLLIEKEKIWKACDACGISLVGLVPNPGESL